MTLHHRLTTLVVALLWSTAAPAAADPLDEHVERAYRAAYNLNHEVALDTARKATAMWPDESRAHRALAGILWLQALFHRGALTVDHYMGGLGRSDVTVPEPPESITTAFHASIDRAVALAESRLEHSPDDPAALYDAGAVYGLQASWAASVEGRIRSAFWMARRAFDTQERVMRADPGRADAGMIVGTYRYTVASLGMASRLVAYLAGFGGGKQRGIELLEAAAEPPSQSRYEARTALVIVYSREGRHGDAFDMLTAMSAEFPDNRILVLERGAAALRAGRAREAEAILTAGISTLASDSRRRLPGERALWFYRRGLARLALDQPARAAADLTEALGGATVPWIRGRVELARGKVADVMGQRAEALARYTAARETARQAKDSMAEAEATRLMRRPFTLSRRFPSPPGHDRPWHLRQPVLV